MKSDKKILFAFCLNLFFSIFEFIGGAITGSVAIISDSIHDFGDCLSIGMSYIFEKISKKKPDERYTFGYYRYSVLGSVIQSVILLTGSVFVIYNAVGRIISATPINYNGMIFVSIIGFLVNFLAAYFTSGGESLNQKAINLHMLEDVMGWAIVLVSAVIMRFTNWLILDAILSIGLAVFIIISAFSNLKAILDIFLEKTPKQIDMAELKEHLLSVSGVCDVHHLHVWGMDGYKSRATLHVVTDADFYVVKNRVKEELKEHGITHATVECEKMGEECSEQNCGFVENSTNGCRHGHTHGHHHAH